MHKDYIRAVVKEYYRKVDSNTISLNLTPLTPANVKKECKAVCKERFRRADERMLNAFFGYAENEKGYLQAIERHDIDKFRPLINFVEGRSKDTDPKNVELLAWLIDFKDRPFDLNGKYSGLNQSTGLDEPQVDIDEGSNLKNDLEPSPRTATVVQSMSGLGKTPIVIPEKSRSKKKKGLATGLIVTLLAGTVGYLSLKTTISGNKTSNNDSCMYWKDDHYERISCGQKVRYSKVVALDTDLLNNFRKISVPETITYNSIGKVWYIKIKGETEFYTSMGYHPVFMQLQLKPITKYIIDNYIRKKILLNDNTSSFLRTDNTSLDQTDDFMLSPKQLKTQSFGLYGQCQAITKKKTQCSRNAKSSGFCWQHIKQGA